MFTWLLAANLSLILTGFSPALPDKHWSVVFMCAAISLLCVSLVLSRNSKQLYATRNLEAVNLVNKQSHIRAYIATVILFCSGMLASTSWAVFYHHNLLSSILPKILEKQDILVTGQVCGLPKITNRSQKFLFCIDEFIESPVALVEHEFKVKKVLISQYNKYQPLKTGENWQLSLRLKQPHGFANPHGFLYEEWLLQNNIDATGYIRKSEFNKRLEDSWHWQQLRAKVRDNIVSMIGESHYLGFILAITLGDKSYLSPSQWQALTNTGTSHLLAISGLHIGLIAGLIFFLANILAKLLMRNGRIASVQYAAAVALLGGGAYAVLAGLSLPTQRALIMLSVYLLGVIMKRDMSAIWSLSLAAFLVLMWDPLAAQSASFWLSFIAVAIIIFFVNSKLKPKHEKSKHKLELNAIHTSSLATNKSKKYILATQGFFSASKLKIVLQNIRAQWLIFIGIFPVLIIIFGKVSWISPVINLLAIPYLGLLVIPLSLLAVVLLFVPTLSSLLFVLIDKLMAVFVTAISYFNDLAVMGNFLYLNKWQIILMIIASLLLILPRGIPVKSLAILCLIPLFFTTPNGIEYGEYKLDVLDVGQGLAVVMRTRNHTLVYDVGRRFSDNLDAGRDIVIPFLRGEGVTKINQLIVSHADGDHAGGLQGVLNNIHVDKISSGEAEEVAKKSTLPIEHCIAGDKWQVDGVSFMFLHPGAATYADSNDNSCVLKISSEFGNSLLTGDISTEVEQELLKRYDVNSDLLIAGHHGSKTSSSKQFIYSSTPTEVVYSTGYLNSYYHPHPSVVSRITKFGSNQSNTAYSGTVSFYFSRQGIVKNEFRKQAWLEHYLRR